MRGSPARRCSRFILLLLACSWLAAAQSADVGVTKLGADLAPANTDVPYTLTVTNGGPDPAANFTLTDPIPAGMTFVSLASPAVRLRHSCRWCEWDNVMLHCYVGTFPGGVYAHRP